LVIAKIEKPVFTAKDAKGAKEEQERQEQNQGNKKGRDGSKSTRPFSFTYLVFAFLLFLCALRVLCGGNRF